MKSDDNLPESLLGGEEHKGFVDLDLRLVRLDALPNRGFFAQGRGRHGTRVIGFALELHPEWQTTPIGDTDDLFYWGSGILHSTGVDSDALLTTLAELYQLPLESTIMCQQTKVAIVGLANDPQLLMDKATRMKLFFENEDPDRYAEVYVNVIAPERRLELHEKDEGYRRALLYALGVKTG